MKIESFDLLPGSMLAQKYRIISKLGSGWEGEVYRVIEKRSGIERAAKLFYPDRNVANRTARRYARRLHKLRHCPLLIQYHTEEFITINGTQITVLISDFVDGAVLSEFLEQLPGKRLGPFEALHLLYTLATGIGQVHVAKEYHGDIHTDNIMVKRYGLRFELKLLDLFHVDATKSENRRSDICDVIRVFYDALGGPRSYARQPETVKHICCGLKKSLILKRFPTMSKLCRHLESMNW
jgi:serine/threonine protein kinase